MKIVLLDKRYDRTFFKTDQIEQWNEFRNLTAPVLLLVNFSRNELQDETKLQMLRVNLAYDLQVVLFDDLIENIARIVARARTPQL